MFDGIFSALKTGFVIMIILFAIIIIVSIVKGVGQAENNRMQEEEKNRNIREIKEESKKWSQEVKHNYMCTFFEEYRNLHQSNVYKSLVYVKIGKELKSYGFDKYAYYELYRYLKEELEDN